MDSRDTFRTIAEEAEKGDLAFPTHAEVTLHVQRALDDPDCHMEAAARLVQTDPLLSARVVAVANSTAFNRSGKAVTDVRVAVVRLGFRTVRSLATALLMRQMAGSSAAPARIRELSAQLWEHTSHVAALAHVIARRVTHLDPETAFFAGIVHEVGAFYLLSRIRDFPDLLEEDMAADWEEEGQALVGRAVLKVLGVPEPVVAGIEAYWRGYLALPPTTLGDTLLLADELAPVESPFRRLANESREGAEAKIDMAIGEESLTAILGEAAGELASLTQALRF